MVEWVAGQVPESLRQKSPKRKKESCQETQTQQQSLRDGGEGSFGASLPLGFDPALGILG